jgi:hypothetical protein
LIPLISNSELRIGSPGRWAAASVMVAPLRLR